MKYLVYLKYLIRHKWFVFLELAKYGNWKQGLLHDISKFRPDEFFPFVERTKTGDKHNPEFQNAWLKHQHRNKHHWQYWISFNGSGRYKVMEMPLEFRQEMLCDWIGAGKAQGNVPVEIWYIRNQRNMRLGRETRAWIEEELSLREM